MEGGCSRLTAAHMLQVFPKLVSLIGTGSIDSFSIQLTSRPTAAITLFPTVSPCHCGIARTPARKLRMGLVQDPSGMIAFVPSQLRIEPTPTALNPQTFFVAVATVRWLERCSSIFCLWL